MDKLKSLKLWLAKQTALQKRQAYKILLNGNNSLALAEAQRLANETGKSIQRIDLSQVISKYIGETEKNLAVIFKNAEEKNALLFFDEADALLGKRTTIKDSHDRYANREIKYLLEKLSNYPGIVVLSTCKKNIDAALMRRFQATIHLTAK